MCDGKFVRVTVGYESREKALEPWGGRSGQDAHAESA
jgi:hypothetical protein